MANYDGPPATALFAYLHTFKLYVFDITINVLLLSSHGIFLFVSDHADNYMLMYAH